MSPPPEVAPMSRMRGVKVEIVRWVSDQQPGWVECLLLDAEGDEHRFTEKVPVVTAAALHAQSPLPRPGGLDCTSQEGREGGLIVIDTLAPWGLESADGLYRFVVRADQLVSRG